MMGGKSRKGEDEMMGMGELSRSWNRVGRNGYGLRVYQGRQEYVTGV